MLDNVSYNRVKLLHELSRLHWFIEKHALKDAQATGDEAAQKIIQSIAKDIDKHIAQLEKDIKS